MRATKRFYLIYQITNNINGKIYIGKHETDNLDDDYFGSGKLLSLAQDKHGLENFTKTILFYCYNREEMNLLEHRVVTPAFCAREDTYNMMQGGDGGWSYVNLSSDYAAGSMKRHDAMVRANNDPVAKEQRVRSTKATINNWSKERRQQHLLAVSRGVRKFKEEHPSYMVGENNPMHGRKMPEWAKRKMSSSHMGSKNPMHGYAWVCNQDLKLSFQVPESLFWMYVGEGWRKGRVVDWKTYVSPEEKSQKKSREREQFVLKKQRELRPMYVVFKESGFQRVVEEFGYTKTRSNLVESFKKHLPEYVPTPTNRWKNRCQTY